MDLHHLSARILYKLSSYVLHVCLLTKRFKLSGLHALKSEHPRTREEVLRKVMEIRLPNAPSTSVSNWDAIEPLLGSYRAPLGSHRKSWKHLGLGSKGGLGVHV